MTEPRPLQQLVAAGLTPKQNLFLRAIDVSVANRMKTAARARAIPLGEYVMRLSDLHERTRSLADSGNKDLARLLEELGLQSVRV
jgi:hypothetical protein